MFYYSIILLLSLCAIQDLYERKVSNYLIVTMLFLAITYCLLMDGVGFYETFSSILLVSLITFPGFVKNVFGASDVKILLIMALILSFTQMLDVLLYSFVCFAVYWWLFARSQKEAPFVPSLLVGVVVSLWIL
ncbi:prepilin peptidase [Photobacterium sp. SP02]|uniref:prepilin peptidase n=1 Tax=Photobacterium sp. SP02 TaxID=3032280 RepID=UPI00406C9019